METSGGNIRKGDSLLWLTPMPGELGCQRFTPSQKEAKKVQTRRHLLPPAPAGRLRAWGSRQSYVAPGVIQVSQQDSTSTQMHRSTSRRFIIVTLYWCQQTPGSGVRLPSGRTFADSEKCRLSFMWTKTAFCSHVRKERNSITESGSSTSGCISMRIQAVRGAGTMKFQHYAKTNHFFCQTLCKWTGE